MQGFDSELYVLPKAVGACSLREATDSSSSCTMLDADAAFRGFRALTQVNLLLAEHADNVSLTEVADIADAAVNENTEDDLADCNASVR